MAICCTGGLTWKAIEKCAMKKYMQRNTDIHNWDYNLPTGWKPQTEFQWLWYLERKINYGDWAGLNREQVREYFPKLKRRLDPGKRQMIELYLQEYA